MMNPASSCAKRDQSIRTAKRSARCHAKERQMKTILPVFLVLFCLSTGMNRLHAQWTPSSQTGQYAVLSLVVAPDGSKIFAGSNGAGVFFSTDNGTSWTAANTSLTGLNVRALSISGTNLIAGTDNGVFMTPLATIGVQGWAGWTQKNSGLTDDNIISLVSSTDGTKLFAGTSSGVFLSANIGTTWSAVNSGMTGAYVTSLAVSGTNLFAATLSGVYLSPNNGTGWAQVNSGLTNTNVYTIAVSGANIFVGTDDGVFQSTNNGSSWAAVNHGLASFDVNCLLVSGTSLLAGMFNGGVNISSDNGANWSAVTGNLTNTFVNALAVNGLNLYIGTSSVSILNNVVSGGGTLPVEIVSFTAAAKRNTVDLAWNTATEIDNYGFEVQRLLAATEKAQSSAGAVWEKVGFVEGHGTTNAPQSYKFVDNSASGKVSYRLKQIERDGKFVFSNQVEANVSAPLVYAMVQNYPNPFNPSTTISFTVPANGRVTLKVYNIVGQEVAMLFDGLAEAGKYNQVQFNASGLASGTYFSRLDYDGKIQVKKMQLLK
jgi:hypothetical protein